MHEEVRGTGRRRPEGGERVKEKPVQGKQRRDEGEPGVIEWRGNSTQKGGSSLPKNLGIRPG